MPTAEHKLQGKDDDRLAVVMVSPQRINHNLDQFAEGQKLAPVLKSNAYGHGLGIIADAVADRPDVPFVSLAAFRELTQLREMGRDVPALIIGYTPPSTIQTTEYKHVHFAISTLEQLRTLANNLSVPRKFHLKVETGMHRYGVKPENLVQALQLINENKHIHLVGAFSHFSDAYEAQSDHTKTQIDRWNDAVERITTQEDLDYIHLAATSGHHYRKLAKTNLERIGIGTYGITSYASDLDLQPALKLVTSVAGIKHVSAGSSVGYNQSFQPQTDTDIAVLPIGYHEGVERRLSNAGVVRVNEHTCPVVGKVSMNATMIDISEASDVGVGDTVEVYGVDSKHPNTVLNQAQTAGTIPYVILVHVSSKLQRVTTDKLA